MKVCFAFNQVWTSNRAMVTLMTIMPIMIIQGCECVILRKRKLATETAKDISRNVRLANVAIASKLEATAKKMAAAVSSRMATHGTPATRLRNENAWGIM